MGTDIHAFVEYAHENDEGGFTGRPDAPAWLLAKFSLSRDYSLFDALGDGRNSQMSSEDVGEHSLFPPRGIPQDLSLATAWEYYDLVLEDQTPHEWFWPQHRMVSTGQADERVREGAHFGGITQQIHFGTTPPRTWRTVSRSDRHSPSWLYLEEIHQSLAHHRLPLTERHWDFQAMLQCMSETKKHLGPERVRLVFWFDN